MSRELYLKKLAYGYLNPSQIMQGFAKYYLCAGLCSRDLCRDVCLVISAAAAQKAGERKMRGKAVIFLGLVLTAAAVYGCTLGGVMILWTIG